MEQPGAGADPSVAVPVEEESVKAPWHFWVMVVGVVLYIGWRFIEGLAWVVTSWF